MPDLRDYDFFRELRWPDGTLVLTKLEDDETFSPIVTLTKDYSAVEFEEEKVPFIGIDLLDPQLYLSLDLESFDGAQFNGKQYEFEEKKRIATEPQRIALKGFVVGQGPAPAVEEDDV